MFTNSMPFSVVITSLLSGLGTLAFGSSAMAVTFPFPMTYGDVSSSETQTIITNAFSNGADDSSNFNVSGNNPLFAFEVELDLGLDDGALGFDSGDTSAIAQSFMANEGDILNFDWTFLTNHTTGESDRNDYAFFVVNDSVIALADTNSSLTSPGLNGFARQVSNTFSYTFPMTGMYQIALGVSDVVDDIDSSALIVENVALTPVPEPSTLLGLGTIVAFIGLNRKKQA